MRFGLIANQKREGAIDAVKGMIDLCRQSGYGLLVCDELAGIVPPKTHLAVRKELAADVDYVVSMGGDGTLLATARSVARTGTPILGINLGSLGFLTQQTPKQLGSALKAIADGKFRIENRMMLKATVNGRHDLTEPFALNDVVLDHGPVSRVLEINLRVSGEDVVTYTADGLVISTPTGSTAYNLAVGGPVVSPGMNGMIVSPISAFSLTTRPMLISAADKLEFRVLTKDRVAVLTLDGQVSVELTDSEVVRVERADFDCRFVVFPENSFYKLLRSKLNWGVGPNY